MERENNVEVIDGQVVHPNLAVVSIMAERNYWLRVSREPGETVLTAYFEL